jgi:uncharacterized tellurite resistance protein B-like protein
MPLLIALMAAAVAIYLFLNRTSNTAHVAGDLAGMAGDVMSAARRFGFRRRTNIHPVESIEDPNLAIAGIACAFLELDGYPTLEQRNMLLVQLQSKLNVDQSAAEELFVLGRWFIHECGGPAPAISRLSRKLVKMSGEQPVELLLDIVKAALEVGTGAMNNNQTEAFDDVKRAFRLH